jgi:uncharacterized protein YbjT (DUF2867 family)
MIALTGATGFIGQHLQRALLHAGHEVRVLVRKTSSTHTALLAGCDVRTVDLAHEDSIAGALEGVQAVIYAAGSVRGRSYRDFELANVRGVEATAAALSNQVSEVPLLLVSSLAASAPELSFYAGSKAAGEQALRHSQLQQWSILRPPAVYGQGDKEMRPIFNAIHHGLVPLIAPAEQRLPFIEVSDLVNAILAWLSHSGACSKGTYAIHDGTAGGYDWRTIQALIAPARALRIRLPGPLLEMLGHVNLSLANIAGFAPMLTPGKARELTYLNWTCDNSTFSAATGWQPQLGLADGVARLFAR